MYSSSSSSSSQKSGSNNTIVTPITNHLTRYGSAPSSFLSNAVDSVVSESGLGHHQTHQPHYHHHHQPQHQQQHQHHQHQNMGFSGGGDSLNAVAPPESKISSDSESKSTLTLLRSSYGFSTTTGNNDGINNSNNNNNAAGSTSNLTRHSSSPAGFLNHLASDIGFSVSKGMENYNSQHGGSMSGHKLSRLGSQLSFTKQDHHSLSQISEVNECMLDNDHKRSNHSQSRSTSGFSLSAWDDSNNNFMFSTSKRSKNIDDDILNGLAGIDSQAALEMATMDRLLQIPQDSVPCKIRAKRGCATHPRSIAERERRTRISGKLKKLQDLVPNMDKQTSYSDMLDLAVQHIKGLQGQIQKLNKDLDHCTCGCKQNMQC